MEMTSYNNLPIELRSIILYHAHDLSSLLNLMTADPCLKSELNSCFSTILPSVLENCAPTELQHLICTLLTVREAGEVSNDGVEVALQSRLSFDKERETMRFQTDIGEPVEALRYLARVQRSVDYFTQTFARCLCQAPIPFLQAQSSVPVLSATESYRIQRSLWRFELCCALSSSWIPSGNIELAKRRADSRISRLAILLKIWKPWEIEELNCVYDHLETLLRRESYDPRCDHVGRTSDPYALPTPYDPISTPGGRSAWGVKARLLSQGLSFLRTYLRHFSAWDRMSKESCLCFPSDEFILPAIQELKVLSYQGTWGSRVSSSRFSRQREFIISSDCGPWTDNPGAHLANFGWRFFSGIYDSRPATFAYLRQFAFCIWDENRLQSWGVLNEEYAIGPDALSAALSVLR